jgi:hypothetical protein
VVALAGDDGRHASLTTSTAFTNTGLAAVHGTHGCAGFLDPFVITRPLRHGDRGRSNSWQDTSLTMRDGLAWQTTSRVEMITDGASDSPLHSLDDAGRPPHHRRRSPPAHRSTTIHRPQETR